MDNSSNQETMNQIFGDEFKITEKSDNWVEATDGDFRASAKIFGAPTDTGINGDVTEGYISKLAIYDSNDDLVFNYDRGLKFSLLDPEILAVFLSQIEDYAKNKVF